MKENSHCGVQRATMQHNCLLIRADVGQVKRTSLSDIHGDMTFGYKKPPDAEGAEIIIRSWAQANTTVQQDSGPDYLRMNKLAALRALTKPEQVAHFRETHPIKLKRGTAAVRPSPRLPSDADPLHTYGSLPAFRSMETIRMMGDDSPSVRKLIQGDYQWDWCRAHQDRIETAKSQASSRARGTSKSRHTTRSAEGHARAAQLQERLGRGSTAKEPFKLKKFMGVKAVVRSFRNAQGC